MLCDSIEERLALLAKPIVISHFLFYVLFPGGACFLGLFNHVFPMCTWWLKLILIHIGGDFTEHVVG